MVGAVRAAQHSLAKLRAVACGKRDPEIMSRGCRRGQHVANGPWLVRPRRPTGWRRYGRDALGGGGDKGGGRRSANEEQCRPPCARGSCQRRPAHQGAGPAGGRRRSASATIPLVVTPSTKTPTAQAEIRGSIARKEGKHDDKEAGESVVLRGGREWTLSRATRRDGQPACPRRRARSHPCQSSPTAVAAAKRRRSLPCTTDGTRAGCTTNAEAPSTKPHSRADRRGRAAEGAPARLTSNTPWVQAVQPNQAMRLADAPSASLRRHWSYTGEGNRRRTADAPFSGTSHAQPSHATAM